MDSCRFVQLEVTSESLLGIVEKMEVDDDIIFIMDNNRKICSFSTDGDFLTNFGKIGAGPKKMRNPTTFYLNKDKKYISIFDYGKKSFFRYHYDGQLIDVISIPSSVCFEMITHMCMLDDKSLMIVYSNSPLIKESSVLLNEFDYSFKRSVKPFVFHNQKINISNCNNKITSNGFFITDYADCSDTVYEFTNEKINFLYLLKSNKQTVISDLVSKSNAENEFSFRKYLRDNGYTLGISTVYATDNYLLLFNSDVSVYFNRFTKEVFEYKLDLSPFYHVTDVETTTNNAFVGLIYPYQLISVIEGTKLCKNYLLFKEDYRFERILREVEIEDNTIVDFYYPIE